jgi:hypothetical protein
MVRDLETEQKILYLISNFPNQNKTASSLLSDIKSIRTSKHIFVSE